MITKKFIYKELNLRNEEIKKLKETILVNSVKEEFIKNKGNMSFFDDFLKLNKDIFYLNDCDIEESIKSLYKKQPYWFKENKNKDIDFVIENNKKEVLPKPKLESLKKGNNPKLSNNEIINLPIEGKYFYFKDSKILYSKGNFILLKDSKIIIKNYRTKALNRHLKKVKYNNDGVVLENCPFKELSPIASLVQGDNVDGYINFVDENNNTIRDLTDRTKKILINQFLKQDKDKIWRKLIDFCDGILEENEIENYNKKNDEYRKIILNKLNTKKLNEIKKNLQATNKWKKK